ncbi:MAG: CBS domain-containing protein [Proteobacteria bacterium]|nr:MAG: CBS domain-containing protein [Pseudomonadota bacterium]
MSQNTDGLIRRLTRLYRRISCRGWTREDLFAVLYGAQRQGLIEQDTLDTIERVVQISELRVRDIMIPRARMVVLQKSQSPEEILPVVTASAHSRFPVVDSDPDKVVGILLAKDLLRFYHDPNESFSWRDMLRPAVLIPESKRLNVLLLEFRANRNHMAIVVDEYGGIAGLVTIEDVLEQIVGEIEDEHDIDEEAGMVMRRGDNEFVVKAVIELEDFNELLGTELDEDEYHTVGGAVVSQFGRVPQRGESVRFSGLEFEVLNADSRRVHLLRVRRVGDEDPVDGADSG